jgi:hypothetical protein
MVWLSLPETQHPIYSLLDCATAALSAKQGSILKGLVDTKANSTGDNSIAFNVAVATSDNNAINKGQLDAR